MNWEDRQEWYALKAATWQREWVSEATFETFYHINSKEFYETPIYRGGVQVKQKRCKMQVQRKSYNTAVPLHDVQFINALIYRDRRGDVWFNRKSLEVQKVFI
jgi:hypothetical protein